jgi:hypothetical protein
MACASAASFCCCFTYSSMWAGGTGRTSWPGAAILRAQWCELAHASMPTRQGGRVAKEIEQAGSSKHIPGKADPLRVHVPKPLDRLGQIEPECSELHVGASLPCWFPTAPAWHRDTVGVEPSTPSEQSREAASFRPALCSFGIRSVTLGSQPRGASGDSADRARAQASRSGLSDNTRSRAHGEGPQHS